MADADFTLRLVEQVTGPARAVKKAVGQIQDSFVDLGDAVDKVARDMERSMRRQELAAMKFARQQEKDSARAAAQRAKDIRNLAKLRDKVAREHQDRILRAADIKAARLGGFDIDGLALGGAVASVAAVTAAVLALIAAVTVLAAKFAAATFEGARFGQRSLLALERLTGSAATASREFDAVRQDAQRLGLDVHETQKSFQKLLAAQFSVGEAKGILRMGSDLQSIGATAEEVQRAILAITQIKAKGRVQAEELLQLQEAGISQDLVFDALEKATGKDRTGIRKMLEAGEVDAALGLSAIGEAVKKKTGVKEFGEAGEQFASQTIDGMIARFKAAGQNFFIDAGMQILPGLETVAGLISGTLSKIADDPELAALGSFLVYQFDRFVSWIEANWPEIEALIIGGVHLIADVIYGAFAVIDFFAEHWGAVKVVMIGLAVVFGIVAAGIGLIILFAWLAVAAVTAVVVAVAAWIGWLATLGVQAYESARGWASSLVDGLVSGITEFAGRAMAAASGLANSVKGAFQSALGIHSPSRVFAEFGGFTAEGFAGGVESSAPRIEGVTADMATNAVRGVEAGAEGGDSFSTSRSSSTNITINITGGGSPTETAAAVRRELEAIFSGGTPTPEAA